MTQCVFVLTLFIFEILRKIAKVQDFTENDTARMIQQEYAPSTSM